MSSRIIFRLKRFMEIEEVVYEQPDPLHNPFEHPHERGIVKTKVVDLYQEIKEGRKTSEWRDATPYWFRRLLRCGNLIVNTEETIKFALKSLRSTKAWFIVGFPKGNVPRLEVDIKGIRLHGETQQFEIELGRPVIEVE